ncbi:MAG: hypothetical protein EOO77_24390 [Oxalobacteraceae bacterium]|nr:MAG: hypothetical protein EOO77_24390 [Oxalobacteraceae bacterium]
MDLAAALGVARVLEWVPALGQVQAVIWVPVALAPRVDRRAPRGPGQVQHQAVRVGNSSSSPPPDLLAGWRGRIVHLTCEPVRNLARLQDGS